MFICIINICTCIHYIIYMHVYTHTHTHTHIILYTRKWFVYTSGYVRIRSVCMTDSRRTTFICIRWLFSWLYYGWPETDTVLRVVRNRHCIVSVQKQTLYDGWSETSTDSVFLWQVEDMLRLDSYTCRMRTRTRVVCVWLSTPQSPWHSTHCLFNKNLVKTWTVFSGIFSLYRCW